jgi:cobyrinic acid a,c-diamide synthase
MNAGFLISAPHSGSGKSVITLGLMRALVENGVTVQPYKAGPDYIDSSFHALASRTSCFNLDPWAMRPPLMQSLSNRDGMMVVEGMMGLFDGAANGTGSCADLAEILDLPIILVIDCAKQSHSVAALVRGFRDHRPDIFISALILNRVASVRHETVLRYALNPLAIPIIGVVPYSKELHLPHRHLGLVQAIEHEAIEDFITHAAIIMREAIDLNFLTQLTRDKANVPIVSTLPPLGQCIAIASDDAFAFYYPHLLKGWLEHGASLTFFSPLRDEPPLKDSDAIYLPGGYPELYAAQLAGNAHFKAGMIEARDANAIIYGECGGYMVLGDILTSADNVTHQMCGLLPVETSFFNRKRQLGYRKLQGKPNSLFPKSYRAHEFHYSTLVHQGKGSALFETQDANDVDLGSHGLQIGNVAGSYMHLIDKTSK